MLKISTLKLKISHSALNNSIHFKFHPWKKKLSVSKEVCSTEHKCPQRDEPHIIWVALVAKLVVKRVEGHLLSRSQDSFCDGKIKAFTKKNTKSESHPLLFKTKWWRITGPRSRSGDGHSWKGLTLRTHTPAVTGFDLKIYCKVTFFNLLS